MAITKKEVKSEDFQGLDRPGLPKRKDRPHSTFADGRAGLHGAAPPEQNSPTSAREAEGGRILLLFDL